MTIDTNDEILQDFLVEADEILEKLGEQLVDLEQNPQDSELLNAVFRGFHTIKGGAGFLSLTALVEVCHCSEDVFNILRQGTRVVDAPLMDVFLKVTDSLSDMFGEIRDGIDPTRADPVLIQSLERFLSASDEEVDSTQGNESTTSNSGMSMQHSNDSMQNKVDTNLDNKDEITDDEFEHLLDQLHGNTTPGSVSTPGQEKDHNSETKNIIGAITSSDEITDDEFELLLDQLHGKGSTSSENKVNITDTNNDKKEGNSQDFSETELITDGDNTKIIDDICSESGIDQDKSSSAPNEVDSAVEVSGLTSSEIKPGSEKTTDKSPVSDALAINKSTTSSVQNRKESAPQQAETTVRVDTKRLDDIMNLVGELVLVRNRFSTLEAVKSDEAMKQAVANLDLVTTDLQNSVMKTRMQPIKKIFGRFPRVVRDLARSLNKEVSLVLIGEDTDLDKNLVEALADPLVHLVRNSVDHGIETPDVRELAGKNRAGNVTLSAAQEGDHIILTIDDDGAGMDADKLRSIAVSKGLFDEDSASRLDDKECFNLIFMPGFSTKEEISDISGRGVGMDVVKTRIAQLNGSIEINSELGKGSRIAIKLPLTLAIMPTLMVLLKDQVFALPLVSVVEIFNLDLTEAKVVDGQSVVLIRDKALPIFYLREWLLKGEDENTRSSRGGHVVVVNAGAKQAGFVVDQLIGQEEVVIKPLGSMLQGTQGLAGATVTGDGKISLILDVPELLSIYA